MLGHTDTILYETSIAGLPGQSTRARLRDDIALGEAFAVAGAIMAERALEWARNWDLCPKPDAWVQKVATAWAKAMMGLSGLHSGEAWAYLRPKWVGSGSIVSCPVRVVLNGVLLVELTANDPETFLDDWEAAVAQALDARDIPVFVEQDNGSLKLRAPLAWKGVQVDIENGSCVGLHLTIEGPAVVFEEGISHGQNFGCSGYPARLMEAIETLQACGDDAWARALFPVASMDFGATIFGASAYSVAPPESSSGEFTNEFTNEFTI